MRIVILLLLYSSLFGNRVELFHKLEILKLEKRDVQKEISKSLRGVEIYEKAQKLCGNSTICLNRVDEVFSPEKLEKCKRRNREKLPILKELESRIKKIQNSLIQNRNFDGYE
jgi:hypothetical protein